MLKFVVLSDLHVVAEGERSLGLDTGHRLRLGIQTVNERYGDADFCVLAGDLTDQGDKPAYEHLQGILAGLDIPLHMTIGNHDDRATFLDVMGADQVGETGYVDKVIDANGQRVILLDSAETGQVSGQLQSEQLDWLRAQLDSAGDRPVIVVVHHHANPLYTAVDRIILENGADLAACLKGRNVRQVIAGHVHYASTALWHGIPFTTLAGSHYNVSIPLKKGDANPTKADRLFGPAQIAVVLSDEEQTLVHFDNYLDGNGVL